jgi:hypothetical protein
MNNAQNNSTPNTSNLAPQPAPPASNQSHVTTGQFPAVNMSPNQKFHMVFFFTMIAAMLFVVATCYLVSTNPAPEVTPKPTLQAEANVEADVEADVDTDIDDADDADDTDGSVLHDETLPELPQVDSFEMRGLDLDKLVEEEIRVQTQVKALKNAKAKLRKLQSCLKPTKAKITRNLFRKGKMYGDWTPSRELKDGTCRHLTYTRVLEADVAVFADAVTALLKRDLDSNKLAISYNEEQVTITLLTKAERSERKWQAAKDRKLAKAKAIQLKLVRKLAKAEIARRKLAKAEYVPTKAKNISASKLIRKGMALWKAGFKTDAKTAWKQALKANPTRIQKQKIKRYLSLK